MRTPTKRQSALAAGTVVLLVVAGGTVLLAQGDDEGGGQQLAAAPATSAPTTTPAATRSSEPTVTPSPTTSASASANPSTSPSRSARPTTSRAPRSSATPTRTRRACKQGEQRPCPDGEPGWDEGIAADGIENACRYLEPSAVEGARTTTLTPGLVLSIEQSRRPAFARTAVAMDLVIRNTTTRTLTFSMDNTQTGYGVSGGTFGFPDDVQIEVETVAAGQTGRLALPDDDMQTCGDTSTQGRRQLPSGTHTYSWTNVVSVSSEPPVTEPPTATPTATPSPDPESWTGQRVDLVGTIRT